MAKKIIFMLSAVLFLGSNLLFAETPITEEYANELRRQAENGSGSAYYELAQKSRTGMLPPFIKNQGDYIRYLNEAAKLNYKPAVLENAVHLFVGDVYLLKNPAKAFSTLNELAKLKPGSEIDWQTLTSAYYYLAKCYEIGAGTRPDLSKTYKYYSIASIQDSFARIGLAKFYFKGLNNTPVNSELALLLLYIADYPETEAELLTSYRQNSTPSENRAFVLKRQGDKGDPEAAYLLAKAYLYAVGVPVDRKKSFEAYDEAVALGNRDAVLDLARFYQTGIYVSQDIDKALEYYLKALPMFNNNPDIAMTIAYIYLEKKDFAKAVSYMIIAGEYGDAREIINSEPSMQLTAEDIYLKAKEYFAQSMQTPQDIVNNEPQYLNFLRMATNAGSQAATKEYYVRTKNSVKLLELLEKEAAEGNAASMYQAGVLCRQGSGTPDGKPDTKKALEYFQRAADKGNVNALLALSAAYTSGTLGVSQDTKLGAALLRTVAEHALLIRDKAEFYKNYYESYIASRGTEEDDKALVDSLHLAIRNPDARYYLALLFRDGSHGVKQDLNMAALFFNLAASGSYKKESLDNLLLIYRDGLAGIRRDVDLTERYQRLLGN